MEPTALKENFTSQLKKIEKEVAQLRTALAQRQELGIKLQGAIEAMQLQLGEEPGRLPEPEVISEALNTEAGTEAEPEA
jgi:hypothetical protein